MALIDVGLAAAHLRVTETDPDVMADLEAKVEQASAMVIHYLKRPDHGWDLTTDPAADDEFAIVQAAILKVVGHLWRWRGDDEDKPTVSSPLTSDVVMMLSMLRDPSFA